MRCPKTHEPLIALPDGSIQSASATQHWPRLGFVPQMFYGLDVKIYPVDHFSHNLAPQAIDIIEGTDGLVLNLSAGGSGEWFPNVVEAEAGLFRNTDVVADAHALPFKDAVFSGCIAMNAFEHYHSPEIAAAEIFRVLRPGAKVLIHTAFLQPVHEAPYHFYNATPFGVEKWFRDFAQGQINTPYNFNPVFALSWIISDLDYGLRLEGKVAAADLLAGLTFADMTRFWRDGSARKGPLWDAFFAGSRDLQGRLAAGIEFIAVKP